MFKISEQEIKQAEAQYLTLQINDEDLVELVWLQHEYDFIDNQELGFVKNTVETFLKEQLQNLAEQVGVRIIFDEDTSKLVESTAKKLVTKTLNQIEENKEMEKTSSVQHIPFSPKKQPRKYEDSFFQIPVPPEQEETIVEHAKNSGYNVKGTGEGIVLVFNEDDVKDMQLFLKGFVSASPDNKNTKEAALPKIYTFGGNDTIQWFENNKIRSVYNDKDTIALLKDRNYTEVSYEDFQKYMDKKEAEADLFDASQLDIEILEEYLKENKEIDAEEKDAIKEEIKNMKEKVGKSAAIAEETSDVITLESSAEQLASEHLSLFIEKAVNGDIELQKYLETIFEEPWNAILKKLEAEGSTWYVWWRDGVNKFMGEQAKEASIKEAKLTPAFVEEKIKQDGQAFELGGAYGNYELWANGERIEAGSLKDVYDAWIKNRFKEKYDKK